MDLPPPLPGTGIDDFSDNSLREEAMRDFEEAQETHTVPVEETSAPAFLNPVMPAFVSVGGALAAPSGTKEAPVMGATMEPGSHRELTYRITAATVAVTFLCTILGISAGAAPWFTSTTAGCTLGYGLAAWGYIPQLSSGCADSSTFSQFLYPRGYPELASRGGLSDIVTPLIGPLGFAAFCISMGVIFCIISLTVSIIMTIRLLRGNAPHRFGTVFLLTAFVASSFVFYALGGMIGTAEVLILMKKIDPNPNAGAPLAFGGVGAGDTAIVFMCAMLAAVVVLKIKTRAVAQTAGQENERAFYTALLGSDPKGHFCL